MWMGIENGYPVTSPADSRILSIQKVCERALMEQIRFNEFSGDLRVCYITSFDDWTVSAGSNQDCGLSRSTKKERSEFKLSTVAVSPSSVLKMKWILTSEKAKSISCKKQNWKSAWVCWNMKAHIHKLSKFFQQKIKLIKSQWRHL